ncbi:Serine/threonine-protein kinase hal4 [Fusarium austroafricanum]|uniref:Serine/threonine-protein kinase hal4 n=1 Tax=Fusarium austroafricanum TaxID=2364996 RepID=A0A8H4JU64_9HYPO|nr:Serine/threonine-protein kinase hal4 [Fusarium austroafricanum]
MSTSYLSRQDIETWVPAPSQSKDGPGLVAKLFAAIYTSMLFLVKSISPGDDLKACLRCHNDTERFFLWAEGLSVTQGHLDKSLSRCRELKHETLSLLLQLGTAVLDGLNHDSMLLTGDLTDKCDDLRNLLDTTEYIIQETDPEIGKDVSSYAQSDSDTSFFGLGEIFEDVSIYIDCLLDLAPSLDNPAFDFDADLTNEGPTTEVKEHYSVSSEQALIYCRKIRDRFESLPKSIVERLAEANVRRVTMLASLQAEPQKPEPDLNDNMTENLFSVTDRRFAETMTSTIPTSSIVPSEIESCSVFSQSFVSAQPHFVEEEEQYDLETFATFSTTESSNSHGRPKVPPMPESSGNGIICPICFLNITNVQTRREWKKHVFDDIKPYICTAEDCNEPEIMYRHSRMWACHEEMHRSSTSKYRECVFCSAIYQNGGTPYLKHLARHLQEVSLAVLPNSAGDDDDLDTDDSHLSFVQEEPNAVPPPVSDKGSTDSDEDLSEDSSSFMSSDSSRKPQKVFSDRPHLSPDFVLEEVHSIGSNNEGLDVLLPDEIESASSRPQSRSKNENSTLVGIFTNLNCNSSPDSENIAEAESMFLARRQRIRELRRHQRPNRPARRTYSELSSSEESENDLDAGGVDSSARRMRRKMRQEMRRKMRRTIFSTPPPRIDDIYEEQESDGERNTQIMLARELPYWSLEVMEVDSD